MNSRGVPEPWWGVALYWVMLPVIAPILIVGMWGEIESPQWLAELQGRELCKKLDKMLEARR